MPTFIDCMLLKNVSLCFTHWLLWFRFLLQQLPTLGCQIVLFVSSTEARLCSL